MSAPPFRYMSYAMPYLPREGCTGKLIVLEGTDGRAVDPNRTQAARREIAGGRRRDRHVVLEKRSRPLARRVSTLHQQPFALADAMRPKFIHIDDARISNLDDSCRTNRGVEWPPID